jgi:hypothetical protein
MSEMTGYMNVRRWRPTGNYTSDVCRNPAYVGRGNPKGLFVMVVQPIMNSDGRPEVRIWKDPDNPRGELLVSGEAYIVQGFDENEIMRKVWRFRRDRWPNLLTRRVDSKAGLW